MSLRDSTSQIGAADALRSLIAENLEIVDVRSEGEFEKNSIPGLVNLPILKNDERHQVGICYKTQGQVAAVKLGHTLVDPHKKERVESWNKTLEPFTRKLLTCWRGGLRSEMAAQWLAESGTHVARVEGGYQSLRAELLKTLSNLPELVVISGSTGSSKTQLLKSVKTAVLDLEAHAEHRGSAFGGFIDRPQPAQATFENRIALDLMRKKMATREPQKILVEDESFFVGLVHLPESLKNKMGLSPVIKVNSPLQARVEAIYEEYVVSPLRRGVAAAVLEKHLLESLAKIKKKLGGFHFDAVAKDIKAAFAESAGEGGAEGGFERTIEKHFLWIKSLLENYYDKMYLYSLEKQNRPVLFEGDWQECKEWILNQFGSPRP